MSKLRVLSKVAATAVIGTTVIIAGHEGFSPTVYTKEECQAILKERVGEAAQVIDHDKEPVAL